MSGTTILLDVSQSMIESVDPLHHGPTRIQVMKDTLQVVLERLPPNRRLIAFNSLPRELDNAETIPDPNGNTNLSLALEMVESLLPSKLLVFCDGEPNDKESALAIARRLGQAGIEIFSFFCGSDADKGAAHFMRQLAWCSHDGLGQFRRTSLESSKKLAHEVLLLLEGPQPSSN